MKKEVAWIEDVAKEIYPECPGGDMPGFNPMMAFTPPPALHVPQMVTGQPMEPEIQIAFDKPAPFAPMAQPAPEKPEDKEDKESEKKEKDPENIKKGVAFLMTNTAAEDDDVHNLAGKLGMESHDFEEIIYKVAGTFLGLGKSKDFKGEFDAKELDKGRKVELEHLQGSTLPKEVLEMIAEKIAKDHLAEIADYYTRLAKMEDKAPKVDEEKKTKKEEKEDKKEEDEKKED